MFQQILEKLQPAIRKDSNYANLERVKRDALWNEETEVWTLPELNFRQALPSASPGYFGQYFLQFAAML